MALTIFDSNSYGFRLHVQMDSVPANLPENQTSGPITVGPLHGTMTFEGEKLEGVLEVYCLPNKRRFGAPLLFDFPVQGGRKNDPIIDEYGRIQYEVRKKGTSGCRRAPLSLVKKILVLILRSTSGHSRKDGLL